MPQDLPLLGFGLPVSGSWATPTTMLEVARGAEDGGWASLWTFQRVLQAVARDEDDARDPAKRAADHPSYRSVHDAVLPLAYVAGHTDRIGLGTATICAPFTPPALLAKAMTTLDHLTAGRLTVGVGIGWSPEEYAAAGVPFARRGGRFEEYLQCLEALWTQDPVEFAGEFWTVPRSHIGPRPLQQPHPPVLVGGTAAPALRRAGRLAQGWIAGSAQAIEGLEESIALVHEGAREAGRDPAACRVVLRAVVELVDDDPGPRRRPLHGTRDQVLEDLAGVHDRGVTEVLVDLNFSARVVHPDVSSEDAVAEAERVLDALAPARA